VSELFSLLVGAVLGAVFGVPINEWYHRRSRKEGEDLLRKIPEEVVRMLRQDDREHLTIPELNELLRAATRHDEPGDPLPYKACPECGSTELERSSATDPREDGDTYYFIKCRQCRWSADG
jgi:predicted RNA-binding Zn-ribbon protein involved in translation (DUF1610 family)